MMNNMYDILNKMRQLNENVDPVAFAALAPPKDKITFADKIAGAKKEVDEMLGDVAAEAMKQAVVGLKGEADMEEGNDFTGARLAAIKSGKPTFSVGGKTFKVTGDTSDERKQVDELSPDTLGSYGRKAIQGRHKSDVKRHNAVYSAHGGDNNDQEYANQLWNKETKNIEKRTAGIKRAAARLAKTSEQEGVTEKKEKTLWPGTPEYKKKFPKDMKPGEKTRSSTGGEIEKTATGVKHTAKAHDDEDEKDTKADDGAPKKKGRPKGSKRALGAKVKGTSKLHRKPSIREEGDEAEGDDVKQAMALLKKHGYEVSKEIKEKAVSKAQQRFMGMVHAAQKGEKPASKEVAKVAKEMPKKAAKDYAKTKHAGLPEKVKAKKEESKEEVEETTVAGSVATAPAAAPKGKKGMQFGKGVYESRLEESYKSRLEQMLTEGMSINASQNEDGSKTLSVTATDDDAMKLAQILQLAGMEQAHGYEEACSSCGQAPCGCEQGLEEADLANAPAPVYADTEMINDQGDDLHKRKNTGQATLPTIYRGMDRQTSLGRVYEEVREDAERKLWDLYKKYENK